jgi:hypothetical protein
MAFLVDDILLGSAHLATWLAKKLHEVAEQEITDETVVQEQLLELQMQYELDEITEEEYGKAEERLMSELEAIREYKDRQGATT